MTKAKQTSRPQTGKPQADQPATQTPQQRYAAALRASVNYKVPKGGVSEAERDVFRLHLGRAINTLLRMPQRCREPLCRRSKKCVGPTMRCDRDFPAPPLTPEQAADAAADMRRALMREVEKRGLTL